MTSLPEDGERRPMSLRQDSDEPPPVAGCQLGPPALPAAEQDVSQRHHRSSVYILCALTTAARESWMLM